MAHGLNNHETKTTPDDDTEHVVEVDKVQVNLFFDGTLNNYFNVEEAEQATKEKYGGNDTSYENALSNVARMWKPMGKERDGPDLGVYVEGMGTSKYQKDSLLGYATGTGETGIKERAQSAFDSIRNLVARKRADEGLPAILEINVYGFSRGAATARHFVHLMNDQERRATEFPKNWSGVIVQVNFVGLFDTVSSEGVYYGNDVRDLGLRFADDVAKRVFHLVALDEFREKFSDTTIASACGAKSTVNGTRVGMGFELGLPGAHSDVGGGYTSDLGKPVKEVRILPPTQTINKGHGQTMTTPGPQAFVYAQGWYQATDCQNRDWPWLHQRDVTGDYYKVALSLMVDMAEKHTTAQYAAKVEVVAQEPKIAAMQSTLRALLQTDAFVPGKPARLDWTLNKELGEEAAKAFRHNYLHLSLNIDKTGMGPRYKDNNSLERDHEPG
jgi:hypothetical protein